MNVSAAREALRLLEGAEDSARTVASNLVHGCALESVERERLELLSIKLTARAALSELRRAFEDERKQQGGQAA